MFLCLVYVIITFAFFVLSTGGNGLIEADTAGYVHTAKNLLSKRFFSSDGITPEYNRTPGYPLFLAIIYGLGGTNRIAAIIQIFLSAIKIYLSYRILIMLDVSPKRAGAGAALLLFNVTSYVYAFAIITEFLFGFFLLLAFYFLVKYLCSGKIFLDFLLFSFLLNYALLIRPVLVYFNMLGVIILLVLAVLKKLPFRCFPVFSLCFLLIFGGWSYRNYYHSSVFAFSTIQNYNLTFWNAAILTAHIEHITFEDAQEYHRERFLRLYPEAAHPALNAAEVNVLEGKYGLNYIKMYVPQYIYVTVTGLFRMLFRPAVKDYLTNTNSFLVLLICGFLVMYVGAVYLLYIAGLFFNRGNINIPQLFIFLLCGYLAVVSAILGMARMRDPFFPFLVLGAVSNSEPIVRWIIRRTGKKRRPA